MNKKAYIAPEMEVMNVETVEMMAQSFAVYSEDGDAVDTTVEGTQLGTGRRGTWGNFWN